MRGLLGRVSRMNQSDSPSEVAYVGSAKLATPPSLMENLEYQKKKLETELANVNAAIEALESHPEVLGVIEKLSKLGY